MGPLKLADAPPYATHVGRGTQLPPFICALRVVTLVHVRGMMRFVPCVAMIALLCVPCTAFAEEPNVPRHVEQLVEEVLVVVDEVKKDDGGSPEIDEGEAERTQAERGVVPFTRTVVALLWRGLPVVRDDGQGRSESPVLIQVKPKSGGGQFRCTIRF